MTRLNAATDPASTHSATRRRFLAATGGLVTAATAGCAELGFEEESARVPSLVEDRPDAVYHPTHVESMKMVGAESAGPYRVALSYSFPHRFWTVSGEERSMVTIGQTDSMHLMASVWHEETGVVVPSTTLVVTVSRDGETVLERTPWSMLSQRMGFHFGDNVALPESGTYDVEVVIEPPTSRWTGELGETPALATTTFELEFEPETVRNLEFSQFGEAAGTETALEPMDMTGPKRSQLPPADELPGTPVTDRQSGDGRFVVRTLDASPAGVDDPGPYLAVSARTPYNRYPLALMSLSARLEGPDADGPRYDGPLVPTLHPELGYHYGATVADVTDGDTLTIAVDSPPGAARHEGYETAFFEMPDVEHTIAAGE